jgi:hypothetical protein
MARRFLRERRAAMTTEQTLEQHIVLERRKGCQLEGPAGTTIRVTHGEVWITRHHDTKDYLLVAGDVLEHKGKGKTLVTAIKKDARVQIVRPAASAPVWAAFRNLFRSASDAALLDEIPDEEEASSAILRAGGAPRGNCNTILLCWRRLQDRLRERRLRAPARQGGLLP